MNFLRNREISRSLIGYGMVSLIFIIAAFAADLFCGFFVCAVCLVFTAMFLWITRNRYKKLAEMSREIDRLLHEEEILMFSACREGELAVLQNEIRKMTGRMREQAAQLKADKQYLADSLADISHQLKTPMTAIHLVAERLQETQLNTETRLCLTRELQELLSRIDWLIQSLLKISRLDSGTAHMEKEPVNVTDLVGQATAPFSVSMDLHDQNLQTDIEGTPVFTGDFAWSLEALENIVKNCMEHTPDGGVIRIRASENPVYTEIIVEDNGAGIPAEDLPHLFERFYRGRNADSQSVGIGLALSRMIITRQNGTIKAENRKEGGARFTVRFYKSMV